MEGGKRKEQNNEEKILEATVIPAPGKKKESTKLLTTRQGTNMQLQYNITEYSYRNPSSYVWSIWLLI